MFYNNNNNNNNIILNGEFDVNTGNNSIEIYRSVFNAEKGTFRVLGGKMQLVVDIFRARQEYIKYITENTKNIVDGNKIKKAADNLICKFADIVENTSKSGIICVNKAGKKRPITEKEIFNILGLCDKVAKKTLNLLLKLKWITIRVISIGENKNIIHYMASPSVCRIQYGNYSLSLIDYKENRSNIIEAFKLKNWEINNLDQAADFYLNSSIKTDTELKELKELSEADSIPEDFSATIPEAEPIKQLTKEEIFNTLVLNNKPAQCYTKGKKGMLDGKIGDENIFYLVNESATNKRTKEDITLYRNLYLDIDCGKDKEGNYLDLNTVAERKNIIMTAIKKHLPKPTCIVDTRNGYHILYSIEPTTDANLYVDLQNKLVNAFYAADNLKDTARILRLPNTVWNKNASKYSKYTCKIVLANNKRYSIKEVQDFNYTEIKAGAEEIIKAIPDLKEEKTTTKANIASYAGVSNSKRINDIKNMVVFPDLKEKFRLMKKQDFIKYLKKYNMAKFFNIDTPARFNCFVHPDSNPSAGILIDSNGYYRLHCFSTNCPTHKDNNTGADIIEVLQHLTDKSFTEVLEYSAKLLNIVYSKK